MKRFRIKVSYKKVECTRFDDEKVEYAYITYTVQMRFLGLFWLTVKRFVDENSNYASICAGELLEKLEE